jgi:hypothetical protein
VSPVVEVLLILVLSAASLAWVLVYFFAIERGLQRHVGNVFGVTIGRTRLMDRQENAHTKFYVSGWQIAAPRSAGCLFDLFIWFVGGIVRLLVIGVPVAAMLVPAAYLGYLVTRP